MGLIGPGPLEPHLDHSLAFATALEGHDRRFAPTDGPVGSRPAVVDLGSGGGLPGLVLAAVRPGWRLTLVEAGERRARFLGEACRRMEVADRVEVVQARAEEAGRRPELRAHFDAVCSRSFGPPAAAAECGAPFLVTGGWLVVSEPPETDGTTRWSPEGLGELGLELVEVESRPFRLALLRQLRPCPDGFPRRDGVPARRPLF